MPLSPKNLLILMADEHNREVLGCYGNDVVKTPVLDALAQRGTVFESAYTTSPICVPARAAFATGQYTHRTGFWDNADAYDGSVPSWHHVLRDRGHRVTSIGKLHFRLEGEDHGFSEEIIPMHLAEGKGNLIGVLRDPAIHLSHTKKLAATAGPGESSYTRYDRDIAVRAQSWLREQAPKYQDKPWVLFVSFISPHFPLICPTEFFNLYKPDEFALPKLHRHALGDAHAYVKDHASSHDYAVHFKDDDHVRQALAAYYGLCSFIDAQIGLVLAALNETGLSSSTRVIYTSDHGDNLGARGLWGKSTMYEESAGVPLIAAGNGIPAERRCATPVGHVDLYPFILEAVGETDPALVAGKPGTAIHRLLTDAPADHATFAEFHASGSAHGVFMIRWRDYKYIHHVRYEPELYDLGSDPQETVNLAQDPLHADALGDCQKILLSICDPQAVDRQAKARQVEIIESNGGRAAILARGDFGNSPVPGEKPVFS